jgi:hypothetical protein
LFVGVGLLFLGLEVYRVVLGPNLHEVVPGRVFRSAQLNGPHLRAALTRHGIRSVINLRGCCLQDGWYRTEREVCAALGVQHFDVNLSAYTPPPLPEFRKLVETLDRCEYPVLIHCRRGSDRTGLATATAVLLTDEATLPQGTAQLSLRYGHFFYGKVQYLDEVFEDYAAWLAERGTAHRPDTFRTWVHHDYRPGPYWAEIEPLDVPARLTLGAPAALKFRVTNRSHKPWHLKQAANAGIHLRYFLRRQDYLTLPFAQWHGAVGGAGFFDRVIPPGGSVVLDVPVPPVRTAATYDLVVDMADERCCWFSMVGSPLFKQVINVVPGGAGERGASAP